MQLETVLSEMAPSKGWASVLGDLDCSDFDWLFTMTFTELAEVMWVREIVERWHICVREQLFNLRDTEGKTNQILLAQALYLTALRNVLDAATLTGWDNLPNIGSPPVPREWVCCESCNELREWSISIVREAQNVRMWHAIN